MYKGKAYQYLKTVLLGKIVTAKILARDELPGACVSHSYPPQILTVEYYVENKKFINKVVAKYISPMQIKKIDSGNNTRIKVLDSSPDYVIAIDFTFFKSI